jgi:hypothetical protein
MGQLVVSGALIQCSFGAAPGSLMVLPTNCVMAGGMPAANIMDYVPMMNIMPFGMCNSPANPTVIAATAAALGVLTPMPCIPMTAAPWIPGVPTVMLAKMPALNNSCKCMCSWGGVISINFAGQVQTEA